jgi:dihydrofolate reductase
MGIDPKPLVRYQVAVSIDGFIAPEDGGIEWLESHAGGDGFEAFLKTIGGIVMGRASFEQNLSFGAWNWEQPTVVMSSRPFAEPLPRGVEACAGEPAGALDLLHARMTGGDIWLFGGGKTASRFLAEDLIDRLELAVIPVVLGAGVPLFDGAGHWSDFRRVKCEAKDSGLVLLEYERARSENMKGE